MTFGAPLRAFPVVSVLLGSLLFAGCSSSGLSPTQATAVAPNNSSTGADSRPEDLVAPSGFRAVMLTVTRPDGSSEQHCVWIADDEASQRQGLTDVTDPELGGRVGMVFQFPEEVTTGFWMKDTPLPLSIAWFDTSGEFVSSSEMSPCPAGEQRCPTYRAAAPFRTAIEVPLGELPALGLVDRSRITLGESCS